MERDNEKYFPMDDTPQELPLVDQKLGLLLGAIFGIVVCGLFLSIGFIIADVVEDDNDDTTNIVIDPGFWMTNDVRQYVDYIDTSRIMAHLRALQKVATNNNNNRAVGTQGYADSSAYIVQQLEMFADCTPQIQNFAFSDYVSFSEPSFFSDTTTFIYKEDWSLMQYSGSGNVTGTTVALPDGQNGCPVTSWDNTPSVKGNIALIIRGVCSFYEKATNAFNAGAVGVLIYNDGTQADRMGLFGHSTTIGEMVDGPVFDLTYSLGREFVASPQVVTMMASTGLKETKTWNVICEGREGDTANTIVVGAHLDSVPAGSGINDNGSGSAGILEMAVQLASASIKPVNRVTFAWWGAEEVGLKGSEHWVANALDNGSFDNVALNLNFDMIGSPNAFSAVYNGKEAEDESIRESCGVIQDVLEKFFIEEDIPYGLTPFTGRSDYGPFIFNQCPAGGLFTGAEELKTIEQRAIVGGMASSGYDACYHRDCDTVQNIDQVALKENAQAAAYSIGYLSTKNDLRGYLGLNTDQSQPQTKKERKRHVHSSI